MPDTQLQRLEKALTDLILDVHHRPDDYLVNDQVLTSKVKEVAKRLLNLLKKIELPKSLRVPV